MRLITKTKLYLKPELNFTMKKNTTINNNTNLCGKEENFRLEERTGKGARNGGDDCSEEFKPPDYVFAIFAHF